MWFNQYPYFNLNDLNLDYLLRAVHDLRYQLENFININTIKYANPIQWNITTQYEANTVVIDANDGTAYLSVKPVPSGVALTNTDYWTPIFTLNLLSANQNITFRDDGANPLSTFSSVEGDWLIWNNALYRVTQPINVNEAYVIGYNIERFSVELFVRDYITAIENAIGNINDLDTTDKSNLVNAINEIRLNPVFTKDATDVHGYVVEDLTVGDTDRNKYESLVTASSAIGTIDGQSPAGNIGVFGASSTSDIPDSTPHYPLGVMGLAVADNSGNDSTIGAGYFHMIRKQGTTGSSIGLEIDCDIEVTSQDYNPNTLPDPLQDYSSALQLSSGGGGHTGGNSVPLSTAISINANPAQFRHGIVITTDSLTEEAICLPSNTGGVVGWWNDPNGVIVGSRPVARVEGVDLSGYGGLHLNFYNNGTQNYEDFYVNRDTFKDKCKFAVANVASATYNQGINTIDVSASLTSGYKLIGAFNLQPDQTPSHVSILSWTDAGVITFYQHSATALTCSFNVIISEGEI